MATSTTTPRTQSPCCSHTRTLAGTRMVCISDHAARSGPIPINADAHYMVAEDRR